MSKPFSIIIIELGDDATNRLDFWRGTLLRLSSDALPGISETSHLGQEIRGAAAVATMAEVERLLRKSLIEISAELNQAGVPNNDLTPGLRALALHSEFQSMSSSPSIGESHWAKRRAMTRVEDNTQIAKFPGPTTSSPQPPLDGKTITANHFRLIWETFDVGGDAVPKAAMEVSLAALVRMRNDVAHANDQIQEIFHEQVTGKSAADIAGHIVNIRSLLDHFCLSLSSYTSEKRYRK